VIWCQTGIAAVASTAMTLSATRSAAIA
jgi:hypothetical protein